MTTDELMRGLAAADPCRDAPPPETAEEAVAADLLLAEILATPPPSAPQRPRASRFAVAAAVGACLLAAALLLVDPLGRERPGGEILDRAAAAVAEGEVVFHIVERVTIQTTPEEPTLGGPYRWRHVQLVESWHSSDGRMRAVQHRLDGDAKRLEVEIARDFDTTRYYDPGLDRIVVQPGGAAEASERTAPSLDPFEDPGAQLRAMREAGRLRVAGEVDEGSATGYVLRSATHDERLPDARTTVEFVVGESDFLPRRQVVTSEHELSVSDDEFEHPGQAGALRRAERSGRTRIVEEVRREFSVYERLPLDARTARLLELRAR